MSRVSFTIVQEFVAEIFNHTNSFGKAAACYFVLSSSDSYDTQKKQIIPGRWLLKQDSMNFRLPVLTWSCRFRPKPAESSHQIRSSGIPQNRPFPCRIVSPEMFNNAIKCAILSPFGVDRSKLFFDLFQNKKAKQSACFFMLEDFFHSSIVYLSSTEKFEKLLDTHQLGAETRNGMCMKYGTREEFS
ncbi:unnamed protein product [Adineta ricciae]|uniref:Uncharacterized protein n=1 Tax=Adineta ricciae TaxID=249248 RepID=A0A814Q423_ADIRI|nr:unnamed protein product [Adineta ricciae]CAF1561337.1 unnamed protein product [Adineta ricciae]